MLHYNFPPFSVGECGRVELEEEIGGKLAWRAINSSLPSKENFPYVKSCFEITDPMVLLLWQQYVELLFH